MLKSWTGALAGVLLAGGLIAQAGAQNAPIKLIAVGELSGAGARVGTNFKRRRAISPSTRSTPRAAS